jgi:hypothetical protein
MRYTPMNGHRAIVNGNFNRCAVFHLDLRVGRSDRECATSISTRCAQAIAACSSGDADQFCDDALSVRVAVATLIAGVNAANGCSLIVTFD